MVNARSVRIWSAVIMGALLIGLVVVMVAWINRPDWQLKSITEIVGSADSDVLSVTVAHGSCNSGSPRVRVVEQTATVVELKAEQNVRGDCTAEYRTTTFQVGLSSPLGDRPIRVQDSGGRTACRIEGGRPDPCV